MKNAIIISCAALAGVVIAVWQNSNLPLLQDSSALKQQQADHQKQSASQQYTAAVPQDSPQIISGQDAVTRHEKYVDGEQLIKAKKWLALQGYTVLNEYDAAIQRGNSNNEYFTYDLTTLKRLAIGGDATAQIYYAMQISEKDPETALHWYKQAAITSGYSAVAQRASALHIQLMEAPQEQPQESSSDNELSAAQRMHHLQQAAVWLHYAELRNDPLAGDFKNRLVAAMPQEFAEMDAAAIQREAETLYDEIEQQRALQGYGPLSDPDMNDSLAQTIIQVTQENEDAGSVDAADSESFGSLAEELQYRVDVEGLKLPEGMLERLWQHENHAPRY